MTRREKYLHMRLSDEEAAALDAARGDRSRSEFIRELIEEHVERCSTVDGR